MSISNVVNKLATVDLFSQGRDKETFVGRPFSINYERISLLICDSWKTKVGGIPQGTFLLGFYENEESVKEALLLRALGPTKLPTDSDVVSSMIEYYKDNLKTVGKDSQLDDFTRYEYSFSGLECRILGTFYEDKGEIHFGADVENFYSSHNYSVYKPQRKVLELIANLRDGSVPGSVSDEKVGKVRYSSSIRFQRDSDSVPVYISPADFLGKRTALFGMTRTGKSNTVKKVIQATAKIGFKAKSVLKDINPSAVQSNLTPFEKDGTPKFPVGQIIFDINGEYANPNLQDDGTAIYELYKDKTSRYSVIEKDGFNIMKVNFYKDLDAGFGLISSHMRQAGEKADYVSSFLSISLEKPEDYDSDPSVRIRYDRKVAAYQCCLHRAGFPAARNMKIKFEGNAELNKSVREENPIDPKNGISLEDAVTWFSSVWDNYKEIKYIQDYKKKKGREWADEELKAVLGFLTRHKEPGSSTLVSGYTKLKRFISLHSEKTENPFENQIVSELREGKIVIVDLSQGDPEIQRLYSERICQKIFAQSMDNFVQNKPNNFLQFYFEEAHNLFPKKDDKDLSLIYNRIAKEGAKLNLGMVYATQEVSSISSNILKNTQNWFIAHLNNDDEIKELRKYYDFADFADGLVRFSSKDDKGFVRMKTYSNPFVVPVQIDRFSAKEGSEA